MNGIIFVHFLNNTPVKNCCKNYNIFWIFSIDTSILLTYYRDSFWIKYLYKSQKQTSIPKYNSTLHTQKNRFSSQLPVLHFFYIFRPILAIFYCWIIALLFCRRVIRTINALYIVCCKKNINTLVLSIKNPPVLGGFCYQTIGGAAGYCLRVRTISCYAIYEHS